MFAFSAVAAMSASAVEFLLAQWLVNGALPAAALPVLAEGEILLHNINTGLHIQCSFHAEGTIEAESLLLINEVLTLGGVALGTALAGEALLCKSVAGCENNATDVEAWPTNLPWDFELELEEPGGKFVILLTGGTAKYELLCLVLGIASSEECTAPEGTSANVANVAGGVETLSEPATPNANCSVGGEKSGENVAIAGNLLSSPEGTVTASE